MREYNKAHLHTQPKSWVGYTKKSSNIMILFETFYPTIVVQI